jgi:hypothetical protein
MLERKGLGLLQAPARMPTGNESDDQPAQNMEEVLKRRREKIATDKLGIPPEPESAV